MTLQLKYSSRTIQRNIHNSVTNKIIYMSAKKQCFKVLYSKFLCFSVLNYKTSTIKYVYIYSELHTNFLKREIKTSSKKSMLK